MTRTVYIFVPGVLSYPGSARAWTDRAVTWINKQPICAAAEKFEYLALPASRHLLTSKRAAALAALIDRYPIADYSLVVAGHSYGAELVRRAIQRSSRAVNFVHLFSPASPSASRSHRLKAMVTSGKIGFLSLYIGTRDRVLTKSFLGGLKPADVAKQFEDEHHTTITSKSGGHSAWFEAKNFENTMRAVAGLAERKEPAA